MPAIVSSETLSPPVDLQRVRSCLSELCASPGEFERFFAEAFDQLDLLSHQLLRRQAALIAQPLPAGAVVAEAGNEQWRQQALDQMEAERARLASVRAETEKHAQELAQATAELGQARQQLQEWLGTVQAAAVACGGEAASTPQLVELQQERARLEAELEMVRNRAAEMSETLVQQKREIVQERAQWSEELKRMRHLLEAHHAAASVAPREVASPVAPAAESRPTSKPNGVESDPVLDSVMAQFEILQKDLARRRKQQAPSAG